MAQAGTAYVVYKGDFKQMQRDLDRQMSSSNLGKIGARGGAALSRGIKRGAVGFGVLGAAGTVAGFKLNKQWESVNASFSTFLGSQQKAKKFTEELRKVSSKSPLRLTEYAEGARMLLGYGMNAKKVTPLLASVNKAIVATGKGEPEMQRVVLALGQMEAKGKASAEELRQLAEAGIPVNKVLQRELGLTGEQVANIGNEGVSAKAAIKAITEGLDKDFDGAYKNAQKTFAFQWSSFVKTGEQGLRLMAQPLFDFARSTALPTINRHMQEFVSQVDEGRGFGGALVRNMKSGMGQIGDVLKVAGGALGDFVETAIEAGESIKTGWEWKDGIGGQLRELYETSVEVFQGIKDEWFMASQGLSASGLGAFAFQTVQTFRDLGTVAAASFRGMLSAAQTTIGLLRPVVGVGLDIVRVFNHAGIITTALGAKMGLMAGQFAAAQIPMIVSGMRTAFDGARNAYILYTAAVETGTLKQLAAMKLSSVGMMGMMGPIGLLAGAVGGAALAYVSLRNRSREATTAADLHAQAVDRARNAEDRFKDAQQGSADATHQWKVSKQEVADAQERYNDAVGKFGAKSDNAKRAELDLEGAILRRKSAWREMTEQQGKVIQSGKDVEAANEGVERSLGGVEVSAKDFFEALARDGQSVFGRYKLNIKPVTDANRTMKRSFGEMDRSFQSHVQNMDTTVNNRLGKYGAKQIAFPINPFLPGPGLATGGLVQFGRAGDAGRDKIPARMGGQNIMVGSGEVGAVINRHQMPILNDRLSDFGGLGGFFSKVKKKHYHAAGGTIARVPQSAASYLGNAARSYLRKQKKAHEGSEGGGRRGGTLKKAHEIAKKAGLTVGSTYRTPSHNAGVGGKAGSLHTHGSMANPGATDLNGPFGNLYKGQRIARNYKPIENLVHDVGSGLHLHLGWFARGGMLGKFAQGGFTGLGDLTTEGLMPKVPNKRFKKPKKVKSTHRPPKMPRSVGYLDALWDDSYGELQQRFDNTRRRFEQSLVPDGTQAFGNNLDIGELNTLIGGQESIYGLLKDQVKQAAIDARAELDDAIKYVRTIIKRIDDEVKKINKSIKQMRKGKTTKAEKARIATLKKRKSRLLENRPNSVTSLGDLSEQRKEIHGRLQSSHTSNSILQAILDAEHNLGELRGEKITGGTQGMGAAGDSGLAELLRQQRDDAWGNLNLLQQQMPIFERFAFAGKFHSGGTIPGSPNQEYMALVRGQEQIVPNADPIERSITVVIEDGAVDPDKIRVVAKDEFDKRIAANVRTIRSGPTVGRKAGAFA